MSPHVKNITVPWVPLDQFDWSFARSGPLPWNQTVWSLLAVFTALPIWTTVELTAWIFYSFTRYKGLYFWSVLACTWGVTIHAIGFFLKFCVPQCNWILATVLAEIGWVGMVSGFSVVLYSRIGLLLRGESGDKVKRWTLIMIITDALLFHVPTIAFQFGVSNKPTHKKYLPYMAPMERVQVMAFSVQETIISAIYIYYTVEYLKTSFHKSKAMRKTIGLLIAIQVIVILADVIVITLDYCEYFTLKAVLHSFVYAFKLQLEFVILNDLRAMAGKGGIHSANMSPGQWNGNTSGNSGGPPSPPERPSGKRWWSSRHALGASLENSTPSSNDITRPGSDEKRLASATATSLPDSGLRSSSQASSLTAAQKDSGEVRGPRGPGMEIDFITTAYGDARGNDVERQYHEHNRF